MGKVELRRATIILGNGRPLQPPVLFQSAISTIGPFPIQQIKVLRRYWAEEVAVGMVVEAE
jgi:hypothetical protein